MFINAVKKLRKSLQNDEPVWVADVRYTTKMYHEEVKKGTQHLFADTR